LLKELASDNVVAYKNIIRMTINKFEELLLLVEPFIKKKKIRICI